MIISRLHKVEDTSVFYSTDLGAVRQEYFDGLTNGTMTGIATDGSVMEADEAIEAFLLMADFMQPPINVIEQIYRNMKVGQIIISLVRSELVNTPEGEIYLAKLGNALAALQVGMLSTAADFLTLVELDTVLTLERIGRWQDMARCADAVKEIV